MNKRQKPVNFSYQLLNIKLRSSTRKGPEVYSDIFKTIYEKKIKKPVGNGKSAFIRTLFEQTQNNQTFIYGKITRFTNIEKESWVDTKTGEFKDVELEKGVYPNKQETDYVFIPEAHRFALKLSRNFTIQNAQIFLKSALGDIIEDDEEIIVNVQQSSDAFELIYSAKSVSRLNITISYTNSDDISDDMTDWMDQQLRASNTAEAQLTFRSEKQESIDVNTPLLKASLELAKENGTVEASLRTQSGDYKKVITTNYPEKVSSIASSDENIKNTIFAEIIKRYRNGLNSAESN